MKIKDLRKGIIDAVNKNEDPVLLEMVLRIFQNSADASNKIKKGKSLSSKGQVPNSEVKRQDRSCIPEGK